jgi:hypothetical protein
MDQVDDFYVTVAFSQSMSPAFDMNGLFDVVFRTESLACSEQGGPCTGSGPDFDDECCEGQICVVGACQAPGGREGDACMEPQDCALGLACRPVGSADASPTCCARSYEYCESDADCCGLMGCNGVFCVPQASGETCIVGDCEGPGFCDDGTCT